MALSCAVALSAGDAADWGGSSLEYSIKYRPAADAANATLWSAAGTVAAASANASVAVLYRLRPLTEYTAEMWTRLAGSDDGAALADVVNFTSAATGYSLFDKGSVTEQTGAVPKYGVLMLDVEASNNDFQGVVALDRAGYVVWYANSHNEVNGFDQFPGEDGYLIGFDAYAGEKSGLIVVKPDGSTSAKWLAACEGAGANWFQINHEARAARAGAGMYTVYQTLSKVSSASATTYLGATLEHYLNDHIAYWDATTGNMTLLYALADYVNPVDDYFEQELSQTWMYDLSCTAGAGTVASALDWSHMSAIALYEADRSGDAGGDDDAGLAASGDLLVASLRNINLVVAFRADGSGAEWYLSPSSQMPSNFTFLNNESMFYNPHDAQLLDATTLVLFDDGNNQPDCHQPEGQHCFSRAVKYALDWATGTCTLTWEFEYKIEKNATNALSKLETEDIFVADGGSVTLYDGEYVVAFTVTPANGVYSKNAYFFVVDEDGNARTEIKLARHYWDGVTAGVYRAVPFDTIYGEVSESPFDARRR